MVVIVHQTVDMTAPPKPIHDLGEAKEKGLAVGHGFDNRLSGIAPSGHVIQGMSKLEAKSKT